MNDEYRKHTDAQRARLVTRKLEAAAVKVAEASKLLTEASEALEWERDEFTRRTERESVLEFRGALRTLMVPLTLKRVAWDGYARNRAKGVDEEYVV
jgi:hypothetical protein